MIEFILTAAAIHLTFTIIMVLQVKARTKDLSRAELRDGIKIALIPIANIVVGTVILVQDAVTVTIDKIEHCIINSNNQYVPTTETR